MSSRLFPGTVVCNLFKKVFFIDYLRVTASINNDEITQAIKITFLKRFLKTEIGRGDLLKCIGKFSIKFNFKFQLNFQLNFKFQSAAGQKFAKYPVHPFGILCKNWTTWFARHEFILLWCPKTGDLTGDFFRNSIELCD